MSESTSTGFGTLVRLEGESNWSYWKQQFGALLLLRDLDGIISITTTTTTPTTPGIQTTTTTTSTTNSKKGKAVAEEEDEVKLAEIKRKREKVYALLVLSLDKSVSQQFINHKIGDPNDLWSQLVDFYENGGDTYQIREELSKETLHKGESVGVYQGRILALAAKLQSLGDPLDEGDLIHYLLQGLPSEYESVKTAVSVSGINTFSEVLQHVRKKERTIKLEAGSGYINSGLGGPSALAHYASKQRNVIKCDRCQYTGHTAKTCHTDLNSDNYKANMANRNNNNNDNNNNINNNMHSTSVHTYNCFNCGGRGHTSQQCPTPRNPGIGPAAANSVLSQQSQTTTTTNSGTGTGGPGALRPGGTFGYWYPGCVYSGPGYGY